MVSRKYESDTAAMAAVYGQLLETYAVAVISIGALGKEVCQERNHEELACVLGTYGVIVVVVRHDCGWLGLIVGSSWYVEDEEVCRE